MSQFNTDIQSIFLVYLHLHSALMIISASSLRLSVIRKKSLALCLTITEHVNEVSLSAILREGKVKVLLTIFILLNPIEEIGTLLSLLFIVLLSLYQMT